MVQVGHQHQVLAAGEQAVDGRELAGDADRAAHARRARAATSWPSSARRPPPRREQRREDVHRGRLARAVGPEQREHGARARRAKPMPSRTRWSPNDLRSPSTAIMPAAPVMSPKPVRARTSTRPRRASPAPRSASSSRVARARSACGGPGRRRCRRRSRSPARRGPSRPRPRRASTAPRRTSPLAVLATTRAARAVDARCRRWRVDPQVAGRLADPAVAVGVLDHRAAVDGVDADRAGAGRDVGVARRRGSTSMSPTPVRSAQRAACARGGRRRTPVVSRQSPSGPVACSATPCRRCRCSCEPAGSSIETSTDPPSLNGL